MKRIIRFAFLFLLFLVSGIFGCQKDDTCNDPPREYPVPASASRWLLAPIKPGDSLKFKVYWKDKANGGKYIYIRDEKFYIKDTVIEKDTIKNIWLDLNCNELMIKDYLKAEITGPEHLIIKLDNSDVYPENRTVN